MFSHRAWYDAFAGKIVQFNARAGSGSLMATDVTGAAWVLGASAMKQASNFILPLRNEVLLLANFADANSGQPLFVAGDGSIGLVAAAAQCTIEPQHASPSSVASNNGINIKLGRMYVGLPSSSGGSSSGGPLPLSTTPPDYPWVLALGTSMFTLTLPPSGLYGLGTQGIVVNEAGVLATKSTRVLPTVFECLNGSAVCVPSVTSTTLVLSTTTVPVPGGAVPMFTSNMQRVTVSWRPVSTWQLGLIGPVANASQPQPGDAFTLLLTPAAEPATAASPALVDVNGQSALVLASLGPPTNLPLAPFTVSGVESVNAPNPVMHAWATALGTMPFHATPSLSTSAIIGIVIGSAIIVAGIVTASVLAHKRQQKKR